MAVTRYELDQPKGYFRFANRSAFNWSTTQVNPEITGVTTVRNSRNTNPSLPLVMQIYFIPKY